ncbi:MAG TPA: hypothetical protein HA263_08040 [Methanoregulaceae archaeon]|nr:hypothetical protein [Methanoregulaceae archaeon]
MPGDSVVETFRRELLFSLSPSTPDRLEEVDGGLLIHDVPMLAAGIWTDSAKQTPLDYSASVLERNHTNWLDRSGWSRHGGGVPRRITEKVAEARNLRFMATVEVGGQTVENAIVADVFLHQLTQESRDTAALVKAGLAAFVSVEHGGQEKWNVGRRLFELQDLYITGFAIVNRGACAKCRLNEGSDDDMTMNQADSLEGRQEALKIALTAAIGAKWPDGSPAMVWPIMTFDDKVVFRNPADDLLYAVPYMINGETFTFGTPVEVEQVYVEKKALEMMPALAVEQIRAMIDGTRQVTDMDTKELEATVAELKTANADTARALEAATAEMADMKRQLGEARQENTTLTEQLGTQTERLKELDGLAARLTALEEQPDRVTRNEPQAPERVLAEPPRLVHRNGKTYREA